MVEATSQRSPGRRVTTPAELSRIGLRLFFERGFDETTVDDIAEAAGIGRRTFFRYFLSKNDLPWGDFDALIERMRRDLDATPAHVPMVPALRQAILAFNRFPDEELEYHRRRMKLLLTVPSLVAHSTLRYADWRTAVAEFAAGRLGEPAESLGPQVVSWTFLAVCLAAYEEWLRDPESDLLDLLEHALSHIESVFGGNGS